MSIRILYGGLNNFQHLGSRFHVKSSYRVPGMLAGTWAIWVEGIPFGRRAKAKGGPFQEPQIPSFQTHSPYFWAVTITTTMTITMPITMTTTMTITITITMTITVYWKILYQGIPHP